MKKFFTVLLLIVTTVCSVWAEDIVDSFFEIATKLVDVDNISSKPRYAFITLTSDIESLEINEYVTDALMEAVYSTGKIRIIERAKLDNILKELKLQNSGLIDDATAKQIGKVAGVDYICYGSLSEVEELYFVKVKAIDVQTGELCALTTGYISPDDYINEFILEKNNQEQEAKKLAKKIEKKEEKENNKKKNTYTDLYFTYDGFIPNFTEYYGLTFGAEQRINYINFGPSLGFSGPFSNPEKKESSYFYGCINGGISISLFYLKAGIGYAIDTTENKRNSVLAQAKAGFIISKVKIEYTVEELFAIKDFRQKVSLGLLFKL